MKAFRSVASRSAILVLLLSGTLPAPLLAQQAPPPADAVDSAEAADPENPEVEAGAEEGAEIVVTGQRERGAVMGDIKPEVQLNAREIRALGTGSISELLEAISPQTRSGRGRDDGRPVLLLNGKRISSFLELRDIPPEAIVRVDILPEEVALKYGYRADQRVVNFVLRERFRAFVGELDAGAATAGGRPNYGVEGSYLGIDSSGRMNVAAEYQHSDPLFESERGIVQADPVPGIELGRFRTLLPETNRYTLNGTLNRTLFEDVSATLNGSFERSSSGSFIGLPRPSLAPPGLRRDSENENGHLGVSLNGMISPWMWSLTGNLDRNLGESVTQTATGADRTRSVNQIGNAELVMSGPVFDLPAGTVTATGRVGFDARGLMSQSERGPLVTLRELSRTRQSAQANIDIPIAGRRRDFLTALGTLSANFNAELQHLSDFGTLRTLGAGLTWTPVDQVNLIASITDEDGAPSMQQLGDPATSIPGVRVFDFVRGETVEVTRVDGGNPDLVADNRRVWKLGANVRPIKDKDLSISANYTSSRLRDQISSFPAVTAEIEAAFPERFERDPAGRLVRIDTRPVNFARADRSELRWGINFSTPVGRQPQPPAGGRDRFRQGGAGAGAAAGGGPAGGDRRDPAGRPRQEGAPPAPGGAAPTGRPAQPPGIPPAEAPRTGEQRPGGPGGAGRGGFGGPGRGGFGGGGRGFGGGGRGGRLLTAVYHTWRFTDTVLIRPGVPELDFLGGSAFGSRGGRPRHELEFQGGFFKNGLGARLTANWQSATFVEGGGATIPGASGDLRFDNFTTVNLRLFADLGLQSFAREHRFFRGARVTLAVDNLFDSRQRVRDELGVTPLSYQPGYIDPLGRSVRVSFRKLFF
jgi:hypothetical protein